MSDNVGRHGVPQHASYRGAGVPLQPEEAGQPPDGVGADFVVAYVCCFMDFSTIWKYVGISNQILATVTLWTAAAFLARSGKVYWIMTVPAMFLTDVCVCYLCVAPYKVGGLAMPQVVGNVAGIVAAFALLALFLYKMRRR